LEHSPQPRIISKQLAVQLTFHLLPLSILLRATMAISIFNLVMGMFAGTFLLFPFCAIALAFVLEYATMDMLRRANLINAKVEGHEET
jgi:ABC-type bacteriocin/lantibiotic exporter with double-glycine peptidase domain